MDENQTGTAKDHDPFRELLCFDGPWTPAGGQRLTHRQTGESFGRLALADAQEAPRWIELAEALADLDSERLVLPRAVIDDGAAVLYSEPDELGESFASLLEASGTVEQDETMSLAADLAVALRQLHSFGAVLGRLRLQDVLRAADGGWALLLSPASGAHAAAGPELAQSSRADVVLLASAALTVLTGRRPSAARTRPPLRSTHPLLDPTAADALDLVLERAAAREGAEPTRTGERTGPTVRAGLGADAGSGMLTASELELLLQPGAPGSAGFEQTEDEPTRAESEGSGSVGPGPASGFGALCAEDTESFRDDRDRDDPTERMLRAAARDPERSRRSARDLRRSIPRRDSSVQHAGGREAQGRGSERQMRAGARPARGRTRPSAPVPEESRRPRRVLAGAAAIVVGAAALAGWQVLSGPDDESPSALGSAEQVAGAAADEESAVGGGEPMAGVPGESASAEAGAEAAASAASEAGAETEPGAEPGVGAGSEAGTGAEHGTQSTSNAVSVEHSPEYAAAALIAQRADALRTSDPDLLEAVYAPEAADLADDLQTLDQARSAGAFEDLHMALADAQPSSPGPSAAGTEAGARARTASVSGTVEATGSGLDPAAEGEATLRQEVSIELVAGDDGAWRILDVTPL